MKDGSEFDEVKSIQQDTKILQQIIGEALKGGNKEGVVINVLTIGVIQIGTLDGRSASLTASKGVPQLESRKSDNGGPATVVEEVETRERGVRYNFTKEEIEKALKKFSGIKCRAAEDLGVSYMTFVTWMKKFEIDESDFR